MELFVFGIGWYRVFLFILGVRFVEGEFVEWLDFLGCLVFGEGVRWFWFGDVFFFWNFKMMWYIFYVGVVVILVGCGV